MFAGIRAKHGQIGLAFDGPSWLARASCVEGHANGEINGLMGDTIRVPKKGSNIQLLYCQFHNNIELITTFCEFKKKSTLHFLLLH